MKNRFFYESTQIRRESTVKGNLGSFVIRNSRFVIVFHA